MAIVSRVGEMCGLGLRWRGLGDLVLPTSYGCGGNRCGFGCYVVVLVGWYNMGFVWDVCLGLWAGWFVWCLWMLVWPGCLRFDCDGCLGFVAILGILCFGFLLWLFWVCRCNVSFTF